MIEKRKYLSLEKKMRLSRFIICGAFIFFSGKIFAQSNSRVEATLSGSGTAVNSGQDSLSSSTGSGKSSNMNLSPNSKSSSVEVNDSIEQVLKQKAKKRIYPGGSDEDNLKVQSQLPVVTRKMGPAQEIEAPEPGHQDSD